MGIKGLALRGGREWGVRVGPLAAMLLLSGLCVSPALARSSSALYYETKTAAGVLAIDRLSLPLPRMSTEVVKVGSVNVFGIALGGSSIYWSFEAGLRDRGAIMRASLNGRQVRPLVRGLASPQGVIAVRGFVYWS